MISLILLGFSLSSIDGYEVKVCNYRVPGYIETLSLSRPTWESCPTKIVIGQ